VYCTTQPLKYEVTVVPCWERKRSELEGNDINLVPSLLHGTIHPFPLHRIVPEERHKFPTCPVQKAVGWRESASVSTRRHEFSSREEQNISVCSLVSLSALLSIESDVQRTIGVHFRW
jgi:hypothetical protein